MPRNQIGSNAATVLSMMESGGMLLSYYLQADSFPSLIMPMTVVSSVNFKSLTEESLEVQFFYLQRVEQWGENTILRGTCADSEVFDVSLPSPNSCYLSARKL